MLGLCLVVSTACRSNRPAPVSDGQAEPVWTEPNDAGNDKPVIIPLTSGRGVVASVNEPLRFVILDFTLNPLPKIDQQLFLYRRGQKVARVKVTGPVRGQTIAADIVEGNAEEGDEVRPD